MLKIKWWPFSIYCKVTEMCKKRVIILDISVKITSKILSRLDKIAPFLYVRKLFLKAPVSLLPLEKLALSSVLRLLLALEILPSMSGFVRFCFIPCRKLPF